MEGEIRKVIAALPRSRTSDNRLKNLETERNQLLLIEEEQWRQKSRAIWLKSGNCNTKYFHKLASAKRNKKHICEIRDEVGQIHRGQDDLNEEAKRYFKNLFTKDSIISPEVQLKLAQLYPCFVTNEDSDQIDRPVTKQEI